MNARVIQLASCLRSSMLVRRSVVGGRAAAGDHPRSRERPALRYTDVSVEGAPPFVALGTAIGALRGLIVDYLWIKVHIHEGEGPLLRGHGGRRPDHQAPAALRRGVGLPRPQHGVQHLRRHPHPGGALGVGARPASGSSATRGCATTPTTSSLHKELAFWFAHKIEGYADDAHLYYKREFCREWHFLLGRAAGRLSRTASRGSRRSPTRRTRSTRPSIARRA